MKKSILSQLNSPWAMWFFRLTKLPAAWFMGVRIHEVTLKRGVVKIPFGWRSQNPFQSTYFAAQMAAAEMSTGVLVLANIDGRNISMLVQHVAADFLKKATDTLTFICEDGDGVQQAIEHTLTTGEGCTFRMNSVGYLPDGQIACKMQIDWAVKRRK